MYNPFFRGGEGEGGGAILRLNIIHLIPKWGTGKFKWEC